MVRSTQGFQNFSAGELSPRMNGRFDIPVYYSGHRRMENFIAETQGPARYRTGLRFVIQTYKNKKAILISFVFNDEQSYILEFTEGRGRVFTNEGILLGASNTISNISNSNPAVVTFSAAHGLASDDEIFIKNVNGMTDVNGKFYSVNVLTPTTLELVGLDSSSFSAYTSGGESSTVVHFDHPYLEAELFEVKLAQQSDTMYLVHKNHEPRKLQRNSATNWTCNTFVRTLDPFTSVDNYPGAVTFFEQRTWYAGTNNDPQKFWASKSSEFDNFTTGSNATDAFNAELATKQTNVIKWIEGNNELLVFGANGGNIKLTGGNEGFTPTNFQSKPMDFLGSSGAAPIIKDKRIIFSQQDKRKIRAIDFDYETDSYEPIDLTKVSDHISIGNVKQMAYQDGRPDVIWCVKENGELIGLTYDPRENIMGWHRHSTGKSTSDQFTSVAVMPQVDTVDQVWVSTKRNIQGTDKYYIEFFEDDPIYPNELDYFTNDKDADFLRFALDTWETQKKFFYLDSGLTYNGLPSIGLTLGSVTGNDVTFTSSSTFFSSGDVDRQIWEKNGEGRAVITSFTDPSNVKCVIQKEFSSTNIQSGEWYFTTGSLSNLEHLEGREVSIVTDGAIHPNKTITNGLVELDYQSGVVHIGLPYIGIIKTNNLESGGMNGPAHGKVKHIHKIDIRFYETLGASYGDDIYNMYQVLFRSTNSIMGRPPLMFNGIKELKFNGRHDKDKSVIIKQDQPLPCTVQFIGVNLTTGGE